MSPFDIGNLLFQDQEALINILDIGALEIDGQASPYERLVKRGRARVIGFEPDALGCEGLNRTHGDPHRFLPYFIGDGKRRMFYETNRAATGSLFRPNRPMLEKFQNLHELVTLVREYEVDTKRLDDIPDVADIDFVKIDVQGAELSIFEGGQETLKDVVLIQTEVEFVELYEGQPLFADVDRFLRARGFQLHTFNGFGARCFKPLVAGDDINRGIRQVLWSDAIYVRDWMTFDTLNIEKLKKLAILVHEVVASPDLCHLVLSSIDTRTGTDYSVRYLKALVDSRNRPGGAG